MQLQKGFFIISLLLKCYFILICFHNRTEVLWIVTVNALDVICINSAYVINGDNLLALTVAE
jgi:hypothetical protein